MITDLDRPDATDTTGRASTIRRGTWALWGAAAGVLGMAATMFTDPAGGLSEDEYRSGADLVAELDRTGYHVGIVLGLGAVFCLLFTAAGWRRWAVERAPDSLAARVVSMAFTASAGALILGYGFKGSMAVYLPGGIDEGSMTDAGLYSVFMFLDFAPYIAWWGAAFAAVVMVWLAFRDRLLPRWIGAVSALFALAPITFVVATGLPGFPGVVDQLWLVIVSLGVAFGRTGKRLVRS